MERRKFLKGTAISGVMLAFPGIIGRASAEEETIYLADPGGKISEVYKEILYTPFAEATGIKVVPVVRSSQPYAQMKTMVETRNYTFDAVLGSGMDEGIRYHTVGLSEELVLPKDIFNDILPDVRNVPGFIPDSIVAFTTAYRPSATGDREINSARDVWDMSIPGIRALRSGGRDNIEWALRADGVKPGPAIIEELQTEAGWERAFRKLDEIKPHVQTWWTSVPHSVQLLHSREIDITATFSNRVADLISQGEDLRIVWNEGCYAAEGWSVPKGNPKAELVQKLIEFSFKPELQAARASQTKVGTSSIAANALIDPEVAKTLPTHPDNFNQMVARDVVFWGENLTKANERFNEWLVQ